MAEEEDPGVQLRSLEIENFKSYKGMVVIGPLRSFTAVIGPNGSGKSNFMDAISFVFGEQARSLRVKKLNELIHGSNINDPAANKCSVTAVLARGEEEKRFQRIVKVSGNDAISDYRIDGKSVGNKQYVEALETYNIVIKPRNFLVFQGQVEQIATMSPKQRTVLLEKISGSGDLKEDYERLEKEQEAANEEMRKAFTKKKEMAVEEKEAKEDKKLADEYDKYQKELDKEKAQLQVFELYHKDREMEEIKKEVRRERQNADVLEEEKRGFEEALKDAKKKMGETSREINQLEQKIRAADVQVAQVRPEHISIKTKIEHLESKIESEERMLNTLTASQEKFEEAIAGLKTEKEGVEASKKDYEDAMAQTQEVQSQTQLSPEQSAEYHRLKQEASRRMAAMTQELSDLKREWKKDKEALAGDRQNADEVNKDLQQQRKERDQLSTRLGRLETLKQKSKEEKEKLTASSAELEGSLDGLEERVIAIQDRLKEIGRKYADVRVDERELARKAKKEELITKLKQLYGDEVYGRLIDACHHSHERYQLAVTKILGKYMNGIIVSTNQIATQCINYMKQQELEPEQFIPLNGLELKPLQEHLRRLQPDTVKLVVDVIQITHPDKAAIQKAVRFACGNAVTCENVDTARQLAYGRDRLHVVTWSGTLFDKGGTISGGAAELKAKSRRWDEKDMTKLKTEQNQLTEELRELMKARRKESDLKAIKAQCDGLDARMKYAEKDRKEAEAALKETEKQIESLEAKVTSLANKVKASEEKAAKSEKKVRDLEQRKHTLEDDVFAAFCASIGVDNIRQYEAQEESEKQERSRKLMEFEKQISKLREQLTYQQSRVNLSKEKLERSEKSVTKLKKELKTAKENEKQKEKELEKAEAHLAEVKAKRADLQSTVDERETLVEEQKKELAVCSKKLATLTRQIQAEESKREQLKLERRTILQFCKMNDVELPFEKGSMDDIGLALQAADLTQSTQGDSSQDTINSSQLMEEKEAQIKLDYGKLPERLKRQIEAADRNKEVDRMQGRIKEIESSIEKLSLPKVNAAERLGDIKTKARQTASDLDKARELVINLTNEFDRVKRERHKKFTDCLETIAQSIDQIYKELVAEESAQAFLNADNEANPYNGGIIFSLVVPGKNYRPIDSLSGGEKTLASLSLLFAIHAAHPSPFFIMDEVDAALDNTNILRVAEFMRKKSREEFQIIIISLKEEMYHHVDALVGIYPEPADVCISRNLTLDLNQYDRARNSDRSKK